MVRRARGTIVSWESGSLWLMRTFATAPQKTSPHAHHAIQVGLPFRAFLLWRRLNRALELYGAQESLTQAAYLAGFSDSAHLSRTFRKMFGVAAAELWLE